MLQAIEKHFISGYGDRSTTANIILKDRGIELADAYLDKHEETKKRVERVIDMIHGFETPFGLELLTTVHWLMLQEGICDDEQLMERIQTWNPRKKQLFSPKHVQIAKNKLLENGLSPCSTSSS